MQDFPPPLHGGCDPQVESLGLELASSLLGKKHTWPRGITTNIRESHSRAWLSSVTGGSRKKTGCQGTGPLSASSGPSEEACSHVPESSHSVPLLLLRPNKPKWIAESRGSGLI